MNVLCPFMSTATEEVFCKEICALYIAGQGKNCVLSRLPIYYNQTRESLTVISNRVDALLAQSKNKV
ncbi:MAG: hypothetical protein U0940_03710 [Nitrospirota bacterium]|nr:hypothetical protein [Nitrospirota bacterium]